MTLARLLDLDSELLQVFVVCHVRVDSLLDQIGSFLAVLLDPLAVQLLVALGHMLLQRYVRMFIVQQG